VRPALFRADPERVHHLAVRAAALAGGPAGRVSPLRVRDPLLEQRLWGLRFPTPVGLAAGYDKWGAAVPGWCALGFGFVEVGTVTRHPQPGNPRPRVFRLPHDEALINRLGFNNDGAARTARRLARWDRRGLLHRVPLGVNIGKSRETPPEEAVGDYLATLDRLWPYADYVVLNVSSPNTPGLRDLQESSHLAGILEAVLDLNRYKATVVGRRPRPVLVKIAPDLTDVQTDAVVDLVRTLRVDGLIVCNTTVARDDLRSPAPVVAEAGGLSGRPLAGRSLAMLRRVTARAPEVPVVSVGGVFTADDAWERLAAGASLVQVWTALVYRGPGTAAEIARGLAARMRREGVSGVAELVGSGSRA